jgi:hypothetical protein
MRKSWAVLAVVVVFVSEVLALGSFSLWGSAVSDSWWVPYALLLAGLVVWNLVASRGDGARVVLYALALLAVIAAGHPTLGLVQAGVFVAALTLATLPEVQTMIARARGAERSKATEPSGARRG